MIIIHTPEEIEKIAAASRLTAETLSMLEKAVKPGMSTLDLDHLAEKFIRDRGGIPAEKGYEGYPGSICASVNDTVVHGIPSARKILKKGDIISIDLVVELNGYMGDSCITVPVGHTNKKNMQLIKATEGALFAGIKQAVVGNTGRRHRSCRGKLCETIRLRRSSGICRPWHRDGHARRSGNSELRNARSWAAS